MRDGKFDSRLARVYYLIGVLYYLYKLVLVVGGVGIIGSIVSLRGFRFANETLIASIFILIWGINLRFKVSKIQRHSANPGLHIMTEECVYSVLGGGRFRYTKRLRLKALREGVDHYDHKFIWTGRGNNQHIHAENGRWRRC
ncbi:MAG: hypothetical protein Q7T82_14930 [Armatimonadota bacterium]|nr:hypothetical protein [Armatimonadota bacterium]